eukprot:CAMPEP_0173424396 /NCGR_PEP_ID=MMETSP1357-20121228/4312_1 /TAXON_ID=77926 /ORGANISM="Hemiselmis rufescens, Strain PCC563" /LENGTH=70 /DNA_ID=CAMNT_0014387617 /DNA_START=185 /DNA_END=397 /DNA_ORIENTATION=+
MTKVHIIKREFATAAREAATATSKGKAPVALSYFALSAPGAMGFFFGWKASQDLKGTNIFSNDDTISYMW